MCTLQLGYPQPIELRYGSVAPRSEIIGSDCALVLGHYAPDGGEFSAIDSGEMIEIVQGIQGGIHTEIALQLDLGLSYAEESSIRFDLEATTTMEERRP